MNPEQLQNTPQPQQPQQPTPTPASSSPGKKKLSGRTKLALWLMIGPTALLIVTFFGYALVNVLTPVTAPTDGSLFAEPSPAQSAGNIFLFLIGAISTLTFLPGLITGIILLATKKPQA